MNDIHRIHEREAEEEYSNDFIPDPFAKTSSNIQGVSAQYLLLYDQNLRRKRGLRDPLWRPQHHNKTSYTDCYYHLEMSHARSNRVKIADSPKVDREVVEENEVCA